MFSHPFIYRTRHNSVLTGIPSRVLEGLNPGTAGCAVMYCGGERVKNVMTPPFHNTCQGSLAKTVLVQRRL